MRLLLAACALLIATQPAPALSPSDRLADIHTRGFLSCGIWPYVPGFALELEGRYVGFDVDICRAIAATILGDAHKVKFVKLEKVSQFVERKDIDLVIRRLTWTLSRESTHGMAFGPVTFYDGQGFLVPKGHEIHTASQLAGDKPICVLNEEHHPATLYHYLHNNGHSGAVLAVTSDEEAEQALRANRCQAYSADISWLAAARSRFRDGLSLYDILPDMISKEPLAPLMREGDTELVRMVRWTIYSLIDAEERGVALPNGVGNYGEIYDRNLGVKSAIKLDRGLNKLWNNGGLMYAPPLDH